MCKSTQGSLCPSPMKIRNWPFFKNFSQKVNNPKWPLDDLWPHICWFLMGNSTQGSLCPTPMVIHQSMWIQWLFFKNLTKRSLTPRWPLTPLHMCESTQGSLYESPMKIHQSMWIQWLFLWDYNTYVFFYSGIIVSAISEQSSGETKMEETKIKERTNRKEET